MDIGFVGTIDCPEVQKAIRVPSVLGTHPGNQVESTMRMKIDITVHRGAQRILGNVSDTPRDFYDVAMREGMALNGFDLQKLYFDDRLSHCTRCSEGPSHPLTIKWGQFGNERLFRKTLKQNDDGTFLLLEP